MRRMSVLHQNSGGIGKSIPSALEISLDPRDFPRASPSGNLSGLGKSLGRRGWISQYLPSFGGVRTFSSSLIHPCGRGRIDSVKINPSLLKMRECIRAPPKRGRYWEIHPRRPRDFPRPERFPEGKARGKSQGSRKILRTEGMDFPFSHH